MSFMPNYPGAKNTVAKKIISRMPPHKVYVEGFLGSGAVMRLKRLSKVNIGVDQDPGVIRVWRESAWGGAPSVLIVQADFIEWMQKEPALREPTTLVYLDPPYLHRTRTRLFYEHEMHDPLRHAMLLAAIRDLKCMVMISHYPDPLYFEELADWRHFGYMMQTHGGPKLECLWMNFPEPTTFHDPRWIGEGYRDRERIKRKAQRWEQRFRDMPAGERAVIASALVKVDRPTVEQTMKG